MIRNITGDTSPVTSGSITYFTQIFQGQAVFGNPPQSLTFQQMSPLFLPFVQLMTMYTLLAQEAWSVNVLPAGVSPLNSPWQVATTGSVTYETFRTNMINWLPYLEVVVYQWKLLQLGQYVTVGSMPNVQYDKGGTCEYENILLNWCGFAQDPSQCASAPQPPGSNTSSIYFAFDSSNKSYSTPFNLSLDYWNLRTCYNNPSTVTGGPNATPCCEACGSDQAPPSLASNVQRHFGSNYNVIDFPGIPSNVLPKYNGQSILQNTNLALTTPSAMLCTQYSTTASWPQMTPSSSPLVNQSPGDEFPIHQQTFIDKYFGRYPTTIVNASDGPGDLDAILNIMYLVAGLIPGQNRFTQGYYNSLNTGIIATPPARMPYITLTISGTPYNFMPGYPFGVDKGTFFDSASTVLCTTGTNFANVLNATNNTICGGTAGANNYYEVNSNDLSKVVDNTVNAYSFSTVACPEYSTGLLTCLLPTQNTANVGDPAVYDATTVGNMPAPGTPVTENGVALGSRQLFCQLNNLRYPIDGTSQTLVPAIPCDATEHLPFINVNAPIDVVCTTFWSGNTAYSLPIVISDNRGYQSYTFTFTTNFSGLPAQNSYIKLVNIERSVYVTCLVTLTGTPGSGNPSGTNQDAQTVPLDFVPLDTWTATAAGGQYIHSFTIYNYQTSAQRSHLAYLNEEIELYYMQFVTA